MTGATSVAAFHAWADACVAALGAAREEIDALNVYPVPDGDTGTNLYLTIEAATEAARTAGDDLRRVVQAFVDGALRGAHGNSGVIMSQLLRASLSGLQRRLGVGEQITPAALAAALDEAASAAYVAVATPVEGTILSVARAAAQGADRAAESGGSLAAVVSATATAARRALARTPDQLAVLQRAGVVDAGGRGLCVVLDATVRAVTGRWQGADREPGLGSHSIPRPVLDDPAVAGAPAYEVMYLLDADEAATAGLRERLAALGDSVVVVGGDRLWNVHVHADDAGAAIEAGLAAGRPYRISVSHLTPVGAAAASAARSARGVVGMAAGAGLQKLFTQAGAQVVLGGVKRCSTTDFLAAALATAAAEVVMLPNDKDLIAVAEAAAQQARGMGLRVAVIPTQTQVQGLAALAVHEPGRGFDDDVVAMTTAAGHTRHGAVTRATHEAITSAGPCRPGDVLGVLHGDFALIGADLVDVAVRVAGRLLDAGGELLTLVTGDGAAADLAEAVTDTLRRAHPQIDIAVYDGGQQRYPLLIAVE